MRLEPQAPAVSRLAEFFAQTVKQPHFIRLNSKMPDSEETLC